MNKLFSPHPTKFQALKFGLALAGLVLANTAYGGNLKLTATCPPSASVATDQQLHIDVTLKNLTPTAIIGKKVLYITLVGTKITDLAIYGPFTRLIDVNIPAFSSETFNVLVTKLEASLAGKTVVAATGIKKGDDVSNVDKCFTKIVR